MGSPLTSGMTGPVLLTFLSTFGTTSKSPHPSGLVPLSSQPRKPGWSVDLVWLFLSVDSWCASFTTRHCSVYSTFSYCSVFYFAQASRPPSSHPAASSNKSTLENTAQPASAAQHNTATAIFSTSIPLRHCAPWSTRFPEYEQP